MSLDLRGPPQQIHTNSSSRTRVKQIHQQFYNLSLDSQDMELATWSDKIYVWYRRNNLIFRSRVKWLQLQLLQTYLTDKLYHFQVFKICQVPWWLCKHEVAGQYSHSRSITLMNSFLTWKTIVTRPQLRLSKIMIYTNRIIIWKTLIQINILWTLPWFVPQCAKWRKLRSFF